MTERAEKKQRGLDNCLTEFYSNGEKKDLVNIIQLVSQQ
jgi:hypothetical protein